MRVILETTKDTPIETMKFMLDLPPIQIRHQVEQVKAHVSTVENPHNPLHEAVKDTEGCRMGRDKSWMGQAEDSILQVCQLTELKQTKEWESYPNRFRHLYEILLPECPAGKTVRGQASHSRKQQTVRPYSISKLMAQSPKTSQDGASLSSKVRLPYKKTV